MIWGIRFCVAIGVLVLLIVLIGCTQEEQKQPELNVFAAISLTDALTEIGTTFTAENGVKIFYNFAASTTLQRQLENGATADVFISASPRQVVALETNGLLETESRKDLLTNRLVLVSDQSAGISMETLTSLAIPEISRIAIGAPKYRACWHLRQRSLDSLWIVGDATAEIRLRYGCPRHTCVCNRRKCRCSDRL